MAEASVDALRTGLAVGALSFGVVGVLAPSTFVSLYGLKGSAVTRIFVRLFGTHTLALGVLAMTTADADSRRRLMLVNTVMNALDTVIIAGATELPAASRASGAATTAAFAALSGYVASQS